METPLLVTLFKDYWNEYYRHISLELTDQQIYYYASRYSIPKACDLASDYLLANGLSEVQE